MSGKLTTEERAASRETLKDAEGAEVVLAKIAEMSDSDRASRAGACDYSTYARGIEFLMTNYAILDHARVAVTRATGRWAGFAATTSTRASRGSDEFGRRAASQSVTAREEG